MLRWCPLPSPQREHGFAFTGTSRGIVRVGAFRWLTRPNATASIRIKVAISMADEFTKSMGVFLFSEYVFFVLCVCFFKGNQKETKRKPKGHQRFAGIPSF